MAASTQSSDGLTSINITPMVDIVLVLLVIFMVTTTAINQSESMAVNRPDAATGEQDTSGSEQILLTCMSDGTLGVNGVPAHSDAEVLAAIEAARKGHPELRGVISCDERAEVRSMVRLLDLLRVSGVRKYAIATEQPTRVEG
ncbi:MAG: biopolymer transporter ExbD [Nannocystaceae bacterium]|nr:biopolymer transporter ExbD [Nannocystaceae bacterium]